LPAQHWLEPEVISIWCCWCSNCWPVHAGQVLGTWVATCLPTSTNPQHPLLFANTFLRQVGDFHRTLLYGGIYGYPGDAKNKNGKLRLLYECAPMSFIAEQAGGKGSTGKERVLDIKPSEVHQRVPLFIGEYPCWRPPGGGGCHKWILNSHSVYISVW
jgi:hypothetical protein